MQIHERMESMVDVYVAGGLSAAERGEVDQHIAACTACAGLLRDAREFSTWAKGAIASDAPPADLEERVVERFRAAGQSKKRRFVVGKRVLKVTGSVAAAIALIFLGNLFSAQGAVHQQSLNGKEGTEAASRGGDRDDSGLRTYWANMDSDVDPKARAIREAYEGQLQRDKQGVTIQTRNGEVDKIVDDFRRQSGWNIVVDPGNKNWAELGLIEKTRSALNPSFAVEGEKLAKVAPTGRVMLGLSTTDAGVDALEERLGEGGSEHTGGKRFASKGDRAGRGSDVPDAELGDVTTSSLLVRTTPTTLKPPAPIQDNRKIVRTADVSIEADSYDVASIKLNEIVTAGKGFVASTNTQKMANGKIQATVIVRVPPDQFDAVIGRLKELGTIRNQNVGSDDVTKAYVDLESRLLSKQTLADRLRKLLAEGKGTVKELMEVEVQLGNTNEVIERIKGEIKYYDNRIGHSTITLQIAEKDLGQPFEYVQTLQANLSLTARDPDDAYAKAQKEIVAAGGQVVDSRMSRQNDGSSTGTIRARVEADKFAALRESLRKLGFPTNDTVNQQKSARGGQEGTPKVDAPLRKELASLDLTISSPPLFVTDKSQLLVETPNVESAYQNSRKAIEAVGGKIVDGALAGRGNRMQGALRAQIDADKFTALVETLKTVGTLKNANVSHVLPTVTPEGVPLLRERAEIELTLVSPPQLIADEHGLGRTIRDTFSNSWTGVLWSVEKLFVGLSLAGPWLLLLAVGVFVYRKARRKKSPAP